MFHNQRIVIKTGSSLLFSGGVLNKIWLKSFAEDVALLRSCGNDVILVVSGAIACAKDVLSSEISTSNLSIEQKQAFASIGQPILMKIYSDVFSWFDTIVAQILVTGDDINTENRRENLQNTVNEVLKLGILPIFNENDAIAFDQIKLGDNDTLSAEVACVCGADKLIILSDVDGLFDKNPAKYFDAKLILKVDKIDDFILQIAEGSSSAFGTGGMSTKIKAAQIAHDACIGTIIAKGTLQNPIQKFLNTNYGTTFF